MMNNNYIMITWNSKKPDSRGSELLEGDNIYVWVYDVIQQQ